ncbi:Leucine-rich repeat-containing protein [Temnothorax longispinosus]|uniref:Leucine-rich repeat-containing protein n=1 Tax=Temnothorax longispinosus TaxID=300112 RepID=A0A4V3S9V6_9HYME|nr:Leucine-rich repeat-containing protein [Temnothorax longispinosus]
MTSRRSKHAAPMRDRASWINDHSEETPQENFITEFLTRCEEYNVEPLPSFVVRDDVEQYAKIEPEKLPSCQINAYGILQIAQMLTEFECLDDLNLDDNANVQENYYLLCAPTRNLRYLSLRMCKLSDNGIQKIANELRYRDPPNNPKLIALNVADNDITDIGAEYIAAMLRTNRSLQSVVLTGNEIQDDGASLIIQELSIWIGELPEKLSSRSGRRKVKYGSVRICFKILIKETSRRPSNSDVDHPFTKETIAINGSVVTSGNLNLQHLSLSWSPHLDFRFMVFQLDSLPRGVARSVTMPFG